MNYIKFFYCFIVPAQLWRIIFILRTVLFNPKKIFITNDNSYKEDGLVTNHIVDFLKDDNFIKGYSEATKNNALREHPDEIRYRAYIVNYFANYASKNFEKEGGDFIELETGKGIMAKLIMFNNSFKNKLYLFDIFKGIPDSSAKNN